MEKKNWPNPYRNFTDKEHQFFLEIYCCAFEVPTEVLSLIIKCIVIVEHKSKAQEEFSSLLNSVTITISDD